jgi:hypothetical protein
MQIVWGLCREYSLGREQVETSFFAGKNFSDSNGDWLAKPNAALYASNPGPDPSNDTIIIVTLTSPAYNASTKTITYRVGPTHISRNPVSQGYWMLVNGKTFHLAIDQEIDRGNGWTSPACNNHEMI